MSRLASSLDIDYFLTYLFNHMFRVDFFLQMRLRGLQVFGGMQGGFGKIV